jgi:hypothetical protein
MPLNKYSMMRAFALPALLILFFLIGELLAVVDRHHLKEVWELPRLWWR